MKKNEKNSSERKFDENKMYEKEKSVEKFLKKLYPYIYVP